MKLILNVGSSLEIELPIPEREKIWGKVLFEIDGSKQQASCKKEKEGVYKITLPPMYQDFPLVLTISEGTE